MSTQECQVEIKTEDGYEVILCQDSRVSAIMFTKMRDYMTLQGLQFLNDCQKRINKWFKQKNRMFGMIQTIMHQDPKVMTIASERDNGTIWIHDILPLSPVMEQPFRLMLLQWMERMAKENDRKIIVPTWLREAVNVDMKDNLTMEEAEKLFGDADANRKETGELSTVVTHTH